jgi:nuclear transport factor 2 (NTF2) superfamily protein
MTRESSTEREILMEAYDAFNARDIERALAAMHPEVDWPNGMEGGYVHGHDAVRDYWNRQWQQIDPHVAPQRFTPDDTGRTVVSVHQVVRDLSGRIVADQMVQHVYAIERGLIRHMEIRK